jgi:hypothetical protein
VPRLINVIADATLVFGYGEERSEIDGALVDEVIADLDATGVLGPQSNASGQATVVSVDPLMADPVRLKADTSSARATAGQAPTPYAAAGTTPRAVVSGSIRTPEDDRHARALVEREKQLRQREREIESRERELAEQRRVLAEQYRLLRATTNAAAAAAPSAPAWPPAPSGAAAADTRRPHAQAPMSASATFRSKRPTFWRRVKGVLLGSPEHVLEDSL